MKRLLRKVKPQGDTNDGNSQSKPDDALSSDHHAAWFRNSIAPTSAQNLKPQHSNYHASSQAGSLNDPSSSTPITPHLPTTSTTCADHGTRCNPFNERQKIDGKKADNDKKNYWQLAIEKLKNEDPSLSDAVTALQEAASQAGDDFTDQLLLAAQQSHEEVMAKRWKFNVGERTVVLRDQLAKIVKAVTLFKDVGSAAAIIDPVHAGLPWAGFCVLMQLATSDLDQYTAMVNGAQEVATIISRYKQIEGLYMSRPETTLKIEFATRLISLYANIMKYQIAATCYYQRNTMLRFLRALPKLDDVAEVITAIRRDDGACKDIGHVFESQDALNRHQEMLAVLNRFEAILTGTSTQSHWTSGNVHWTVTRSVNPLFTGRGQVLSQIEEAVRRSLAISDYPEPCRMVITGMGGQGKSEICLQIANLLRQFFWGAFWVDVSTATSAETGFLTTAKMIHLVAENLVEARQALSNIQQPWLLILDNADDPNFDYQAYLPTGKYGVVLMTSRNSECRRYATVLHDALALEGLDDGAARELLLKSANIPLGSIALHEGDAQMVSTLLSSHPLALIQAGSYVACGHCTLHEYPRHYQRHHQRLLKFRPTQVQSRYGHVYATFEASAEVLQSSSDEAAQDALQVLSMFSMLGSSPLPLAVFEATWRGAQKTAMTTVEDDDIDNLSQWHVKQLISLIEVDADAWDSFRLIEAIRLLTSLSLITANSKDGQTSVSMHPLTHVWTKDRQERRELDQSWITTGSMIALSKSDHTLWQRYERQLRPHLQAYLNREMSDIFGCGPQLMVVRIVLSCGWLLNRMRDDSRLFSLMNDLFSKLYLNSGKVRKQWVSLYDLAGRNLYNYGRVKESVSLLEEVVKIREQTVAAEHPDRLASQHGLAGAYQANGQVKEAVSLLEEVVKIREQTLAAEHPDRLASQHELARAYQANGKVKEAVSLLEKVVKIREQTLAVEHQDRLVSQHELAKAYRANGQVKEAVSLLEKVVKIQEQTFAAEHPDRLASQHELAGAYQRNGQVKEAVSLLEKVVKIREQTLAAEHPDRLASQHGLAGAYRANGQIKEAVFLLEEVVRIKKQTQAAEHPDRLASQHELAGAYRANGQIKEAVSLLEEVVKIREQTLAVEHPSRLTSQHGLALALWDNYQRKEAVGLMESVVQHKQRVLRLDHPSRLVSEEALAWFYQSLSLQTP